MIEQYLKSCTTCKYWHIKSLSNMQNNSNINNHKLHDFITPSSFCSNNKSKHENFENLNYNNQCSDYLHF